MQRRVFLGTGISAVMLSSALHSLPAADSEIEQIFGQLTALRQQMGLAELTAHPALMDMAHRQAHHIRRLGQSTHLGPDGNPPPERALQSGYTGQILGEALAQGQPGTPAEIMNMWLSYALTRSVLLDSYARDIGLGGGTPTDAFTFSLVVGFYPIRRMKTLPRAQSALTPEMKSKSAPERAKT